MKYLLITPLYLAVALAVISCTPPKQQISVQVPSLRATVEENYPSTKTSLANLVKELPQEKLLAFIGLRDLNGSNTSLATAVFHSIEPQVLQACQAQNIQLIERDAMQLILDEWKLEMSGLTGGDKGARELLGADIILTGKVAREGQMAHLYLKALDLSNGTILSATEAWQTLPQGITEQAENPPSSNQWGNKATSADGNLKLWTETKGYSFGENLAVFFEVATPGYVTLIDITPDGEKTVLFPNAVMKDNYCRPGTTYRMPPADSPLQIEITGPAGIDRIIGFTSDKPGLDSRVIQTRGVKFTNKLVATTQSRTAISISIKAD